MPQGSWAWPLVPADVAAVLADARRSGRTLDVTLTDEVAVTLDDAYAVQQAVTELRRAAGESEVGWKLGYTSTAMRTQMGIEGNGTGDLGLGRSWIKA